MNFPGLLPSLEALTHWIGSASAHAAGLVLLLLVIQAVAGRRLGPRWMHALWLLVVLRLLLPAAPSSSWSVFNLIPHLPEGAKPRAARLGAAPAARPSQVPSSDSSDLNPLAFAPIRARSASTATPPIMDPPTSNVPTRPESGTFFLPLLWLAGCLMVLVIAIACHLNLRRRVARARPVTDPAILALIRSCQSNLGLTQPIRAVELNDWSSPAVFGLRRPCLVFPAALLCRLAPEELRWIVLHELAHLRRGDLPLNGLMVLLQALHWFNPLVWLAFARLRAERELACDAAVLERVPNSDRRSYGEILVRLARDNSRLMAGPVMAAILGRTTALKRRITHIASFHTSNRGRLPATVAMAAALVLVVMTFTSSARQSNPAVPSQSQPPHPVATAVSQLSNPPDPVPNPHASMDRMIRGLEQEEARLREEVLQARHTLLALQARLSMLPDTRTGSGPQGGAGGEVRFLERARVEAWTRQMQLRNQQTRLEALPQPEQTRALLHMSSDTRVSTLRTRRIEAEQNGVGFGPDHPAALGARSLIHRIDAQLEQVASGTLEALDIMAAASQSHYETMNALWLEAQERQARETGDWRAWEDARETLSRLESALYAVQNRLFEEQLEAKLRQP